MVSRRPPEADAYHFRTNNRSELTVFQPKDLRAPTPRLVEFLQVRELQGNPALGRDQRLAHSRL